MPQLLISTLDFILLFFHKDNMRTKETIDKWRRTLIENEENYKKFCETMSKVRTGKSSGMKGKHHSEKTKLIIRAFKHTEEQKKKMREHHAKYWLGKKRSKEDRKKMSLSYNKENHMYWLNKERPEETKIKIASSLIINAKNNPNYGMKGKYHSEEAKNRMRKKAKLRTGEKATNWRGGLTFIDYPEEFNEQLKEVIRQRDNYKCQLCGCLQIECIEKLNIHYIDHNKKNNDPRNLISLCRRCHGKTFKKNFDINSLKDYVVLN